MTKYRIRNLRLREISTVDRPAQTPAVVALIKRQGEEDVTYDTILKNATAVAKGEKPAHARADYEAALLKRAAVLAKEQGLTPEQALSRNLSSDPELRDLGTAYEHANAAHHAASLPNRAAA